MFPRNVPKRSLRMFPECFHEKFYERSIQMLSERSYGRLQERSLWIFSEYCCGTFSQYSFWTFLERPTGTFREHCFGTFKKPGHFLSSRNVPMEPSEHSMGTFREGIVLWGHGLKIGPRCINIDRFFQSIIFNQYFKVMWYLGNYQTLLILGFFMFASKVHKIFIF